MNRTDILQSLCIGDVLMRPATKPDEDPVYYVIRAMHFRPECDARRGLLTITIGFTLFHTATLEDREVTADEMVKEFSQNALQPYTPSVTRRVRWDRIPAPHYSVMIKGKRYVIRPGKPLPTKPHDAAAAR